MKRFKEAVASLALLSAIAMTPGLSLAEGHYDVGASDTEIKIGNVAPYSGPAAGIGTSAKMNAAYFQMINEKGGVNGRKITFISYDDAYNPAKSVEQVRKLVEGDEVLAVFQPVGTATNTAIQKYLNQKKVPQLFAISGAAKFYNHQDFPWTIGWTPTYQGEGRLYAKHILESKPDGKIAVLYQNDDLGKEYLKGLKEGLGDKASMIVAEQPYELSDPTVQSRIVDLKASGADVFVNAATPKFAAQAIRNAAELNWKPLHILSTVSHSVGATLKQAGLENSKGIITSAFDKDYGDTRWDNDPGMKEFSDFMDKYMPGADKFDGGYRNGYTVSKALIHVLEQCGDDLTRENVMRQAASLKDFQVGTMLPGVKANTSADDFYPLEQMQLLVFNGAEWEPIGDVVDIPRQK